VEVWKTSGHARTKRLTRPDRIHWQDEAVRQAD